MITINNIDRGLNTISGNYQNSEEGKLMLKSIIDGLMYSVFNKQGENIFNNWKRINMPDEDDNTKRDFIFQVPNY